MKNKSLIKCPRKNNWILEQFPEKYEEMTYIEPFFGGANLLINKKPSKEEAINDSDKGLIVLFRVLRDQIDEFISNIKRIKYNQTNFANALEFKYYTNEMSQAIDEFVLRRMSWGGFKKSYTEIKPTDSWEAMIESLPEISKRLQNVYIFNMLGIELLKVYNEDNVIAYIDPPPLVETVESTDEHVRLATLLTTFKGKVLLSGHPSRLYNKLYKSWKCEKKKPNKKELLWLNF